MLNKYTNYYEDPYVYLVALEMDIRSTKYIYELDPVENYSSLIKKLNNKEFIFNTIFDKDTIDYHDLDGAMVLFLLSFDLSTIYRPVKSLKELCAIKLAKSMNKMDMLEVIEMMKTIPTDISDLYNFRSNLSKYIQKELFNEYIDCDRKCIYKYTDEYPKKIKTKNYYVIIDNKYYFTKIVKMKHTEHLSYNKDLTIECAYDEYEDGSFDGDTGSCSDSYDEYDRYA